MSEKIRWGILGTGKIANRFAKALAMLPDAEAAAVGSRSAEGAQAFAEQHGFLRWHEGYEALVQDPEVDVVYVATPHTLHREHSLMALEAGKAVLCEKPFAINAGETEEVMRVAREKGLFLMEAMWSRFIPLISKLRELLSENVIGDVRMIAADFGYQGRYAPEHRLFNQALGGGALLDVGVYPISLVSMIWGEPLQVTSMSYLGETGVDEQTSAILGYEGGRMATLYTSVQVDTPVEAVIMGTEGRIKIHRRMHHPSRLSLLQDGREEQVIEMPVEGNGLHYQAVEVMRCIRAGQTESAVMPHEETLSVMRTLDRIRKQCGLQYPGE